jgi:UDPglucose 6-dehydrogenase
MREAPSIVIIEELLKRGAQIEAHDPEALAEARKLFGNRINYHRVNYDALQGTDALLIVTEWSEFRRPDFPRMKTLMKSPTIFDGRNLYEHDVMRAQGFAYYPIGRTAVEASASEGE